jgi:hypothetical protein
MTNRRLTVWQQITVEISGHPLSGSYAVEDGIVKVKTRASPIRRRHNGLIPRSGAWARAREIIEEFRSGSIALAAVRLCRGNAHRRSASRVLVLEPLRAARMKRSRVAAPH